MIRTIARGAWAAAQCAARLAGACLWQRLRNHAEREKPLPPIWQQAVQETQRESELAAQVALWQTEAERLSAERQSQLVQLGRRVDEVHAAVRAEVTKLTAERDAAISKLAERTQAEHDALARERDAAITQAVTEISDALGMDPVPANLQELLARLRGACGTGEEVTRG